MSKKAIGWFYVLWIIGEIVCTIFFLSAFSTYNDLEARPEVQYYIQHGISTVDIGNFPGFTMDEISQEGERYSEAKGSMEDAITFASLAGILGLIAWIGTLINLSRGQQWIWFILTFFFGGVMLLVYLIGGPAVPKAGQIQQGMAYSSQGAHPLLPSAQPPNPQASQSQPSPLEVLQLRLVRGEIDEQTYQRLREMLKS